jgi:hypothetical protein
MEAKSKDVVAVSRMNLDTYRFERDLWALANVMFQVRGTQATDKFRSPVMQGALCNMGRTSRPPQQREETGCIADEDDKKKGRGD